MGLFSRFRSTPPPAAPYPAAPSAIDLGQALEIALVKSVEAQSNVANAMGSMAINNLKAVAEIQESIFKQRSRAGRANAKHAKRTKQGRFMPKSAYDCRLCQNPTVSNPSADEIRKHINHEDPSMNYRVEDGAVHVDMDAAKIEKDPRTGQDVVECAECAQGIEHVHGVN